MSDERDEGSSITRRRLLGGVGAVGATSLAGCSKPLFGDDEPTRPSSLDQVQLAQIPAEHDPEDARIAIPSNDVIKTFGLRHQQQIRIARPGETFDGDFLSALYTTKQNVDFNQNRKKTIWMSASALDRINAGEDWYVSVSPTAPNPELSTDGDAEQNSEFVEQTIDAGGDLIAIAPHGGDIHPMTDTQALRVSSEMQETAWVCHGYNRGGGAYERWFVHQTLLHPRSFPKLGELIGYDGDEAEDNRHEYDRSYDYGVLFTGTEKRGVYIGGLVEDKIKNKVRDAIAEELTRVGGGNLPVSIVRTGDLAGTDTKNIANRLSDDGHQGVQIAQGAGVRENYWKAVSDAVIAALSDD